MKGLPRWAYGPFELILHGELHLRAGHDFDRRMAFISFDNAIEFSVTTYLTINPMLRGGFAYKREDVDGWTKNFHTRLEFFEVECLRRQVAVRVDRQHLVWYHDIRNEQYHGGKATVPDKRDLDGIRDAAMWVFSTLFDVTNLEDVLEQEIQAALTPPTTTSIDRDTTLDEAIDAAYEPLELGGQDFFVSDLLYGFDPIAYRDLGLSLMVLRGFREAS